MKYPTVSDNPAVQAHYEKARREGTSHSLAEMFALGQGPMLRTDTTFLAGHTNGSQFENTPHMGDFYAAEARKGGVDPKGKVYLSGLADYPGDPRAWVSGRGDVQKVCEERGWGARGSVNIKPRMDDTPPAPAGPAPDIVAERVEKMVAKNPELAHADQGELAHQAAESLKPVWQK